MDNSDAIFLLDASGQLEKVPYAPYSSEDVLQELLERYPTLIVGEQIDEGDPPRWILVSREAGIPDAEESSNRWSLDHLLIDHRGRPTFIEVKRISDTRIRREVVGQMFDYAANATRYWPADRIRSLAAARAGGVEKLDQQIQELLSSDSEIADVETYWDLVEENLRDGYVRLLFVADELPRELRRIIEFLNEHMPKIDVLGVEVRHYAGSDIRAIVPRVVGQTERAKDVKRPQRSTQRTDEHSFLGACPGWSHDAFNQVLAGARSENLKISWGTKGFSIRGARPDGKLVSILYGYPAGATRSDDPYLEIYLKDTITADGADLLRSQLQSLGGFEERGQHTIRLTLRDPADTKVVGEALPHIWALYRRIQQNGPARQDLE